MLTAPIDNISTHLNGAQSGCEEEYQADGWWWMSHKHSTNLKLLSLFLPHAPDRSSCATLAERNHHMRIAHTTHINNSIDDESKPFACPITSCKMRYNREGWLTRYIEQCHQVSGGASTPPLTTTTTAIKNKSRIPTSEFKCPLCSKILPTKKGMTLHCYLKHRFSVLKGMFLNETTVGTTASSSESRLGLPDSGPQWVNSLHRSCWP